MPSKLDHNPAPVTSHPMAHDPSGGNTAGIEITDSAGKQISEMRSRKATTDLALRVEVIGGGCAGFQYRFTWESGSITDGDSVFYHSTGVSVRIDPESLDILQGSVLDYRNELIGSWFQIRNPKASSSCGCGSSFGLS